MKDRLNGMRVFAQVVEAKSFSAAADKLGMSKSLASRHVSALESSLSVKLLNRSTRRLSLTEAGALLIRALRQDRAGGGVAEQRLARTQSEPAGLLRVTAVPAFAVRHVLPALSEFYQRYPKIRVNLSCTNRPVDLGDERFDLGIRVSFKPPRTWWRASSLGTGPSCALRRTTSSGTACRGGSRTSASMNAFCFQCLHPRGSGRCSGTDGNIRASGQRA